MYNVKKSEIKMQKYKKFLTAKVTRRFHIQQSATATHHNMAAAETIAERKTPLSPQEYRGAGFTNVGTCLEKFVGPTHRMKLKSPLTVFCSIFVVQFNCQFLYTFRLFF